VKYGNVPGEDIYLNNNKTTGNGMASAVIMHTYRDVIEKTIRAKNFATAWRKSWLNDKGRSKTRCQRDYGRG